MLLSFSEERQLYNNLYTKTLTVLVDFILWLIYSLW